MAASKSSSGGSRKPAGARSAGSRTRSGASRRTSGSSRSAATTGAQDAAASGPESGRSSVEGFTGFVEQLVNYVINPLGLVLLTRERIQETLDEAAARGHLTRSDATELAAELVRRGRLQTEELLSDTERLIVRGREQFESAGVRSRFSGGVDRIVRTADRARRTVALGPSFPILGYDDLTAAQVNSRLKGLSGADLRRVREYERRHANRKSVLEAIERALA
jgi:polyhydroxyalkanoate synthesis regulator phasin